MVDQLPVHHLLSDTCRIPIERAVSEYYGNRWHVTNFQDMDDFACHPAAILSDGTHPVFVKLSEAVNGLDQFEVELAGLKYLSERAGILTPTLINILQLPCGVLLILEAVQAVERRPIHWREHGRTLARIHQVKGEKWGFERQGYFGPLYQDNRPTRDWKSFFIERRLWPRFMGAIDSGNLPTEMIRQIESLIKRVSTLPLPEGQPMLLHGDAQQNNFITTAQGVMVVDPAVYYGNPEMDLAYVDYFQPVPDDVWQGYQELLPIEDSFSERRDLYRVPGYLAAITVEGKGYLDMLNNTIRRYL